MLSRLARMGLRNLGRNRRRTAIASLALGGGLALSSVTWVFAEGMLGDSIDKMVLGQTGHLQVQHPGQVEEPNLYDTLPDTEALSAELREDPRVLAVAPRIEAAGLLSVDDLSLGASLKGVDPESERAFNAAGVSQGEWLSDAGQVVLGEGLARRLKVAVGDEVFVITQDANGGMANASWQVVGLRGGPVGSPDQATAWVSLDEAQQLLSLDGAHRLVVMLEDTRLSTELTRELGQREGWSGVLADDPTAQAPPADIDAAQLSPTHQLLRPEATAVVRSWRALNPMMAEYQSLSDVWVMLAVGIVLATAAMGAANVLLMSVLERTRELGTLIAVGMRPRQLILMVLFEGLFMGALSTVVGLLLGLGISWMVVNQGIDLRGFYADFSFAGITFEPIFKGRWLIRAFTLPTVVLAVVCVLASVLPAVRASRIDPIKAMRA